MEVRVDVRKVWRYQRGNQNRKSKKDSLHAGATMAKQRDQRTHWSTKDPTKVEQELLTLPEHLSFRGVRVTRSLVFCVMFWRSLFVLLSFYFWPLCCLSFFDLRILSTPLVSLNSSYNHLILSPRHVFITLPYQNQLRSPIDQLVYTGYPKLAKVAYGPTGVHRVSKIS